MTGQHRPHVHLDQMVKVWCYAGLHCPFLITTMVTISAGITPTCNGKKYFQCHYGTILQ